MKDVFENVNGNPTNGSQVMNPMLDAMVNEAAKSPSELEKAEAALLEAMRDCSISVNDDIAADVNTLCIKGVDTYAYQGIHFVKAKAKQGKTSMLCILESIFISSQGRWGSISRIDPHPLKVYHIDTEQKAYDTQCFKRQMFKLAGTTEEVVADRYAIFNLRGIIDNAQKKSMIEAVLKSDRPDVLVIDGIVDLINNFNDVDESKELIAWLMHLADEYNIVLICVLHTNKNSMDHNMRGHLGTMSEQKCDTTTECEKDDASGIVTAKCANSRHRPYPDWSFTWDQDGNLVDADYQLAEIARQKAEEQRISREQKSQQQKDERRQKMLALVNVHGGSIARSQLTELLEKEFNVSRKTISPLISGWVSDGTVFENGNLIQTTPQAQLFCEE